LRKEHKLAIIKKDGVLRYDVDRMNGNRKTKKVPGKSRNTG